MTKAERKAAKAKRRDEKKWRGFFLSWATRLGLALTKANPVEAAQPEAPATKAAETYRARPASEILKRVGKVEVYEEAGDRLIKFAPRGWHAEESFAYNRNKPTPVQPWDERYKGKFEDE